MQSAAERPDLVALAADDASENNTLLAEVGEIESVLAGIAASAKPPTSHGYWK